MTITTFTVTMPNTLALSPTVTDDGLPAGYPLQKLWYTKQGPAQAVFADPTAAATTVTFPAAGAYEIVLLVSDAEYVATKTVTVTVIPQNFPPTIVNVSTPATADIAEAALLSAVVTDDGLPAGSTLSSNWSKISGPGTVTFGSPPPTGPITTATFSAVGTYVVQLEATDGALAVSQQVTIEVIVVNKAPVVNAGADVALSAPTMSTTLSGSATDDGLPVGSTLSYAWSVYGGPEGVTFGSPAAALTTVSFAQPGSYVIRLSVSDGEKTGTDDVNVSVAAPDGAVPVVSLDGLADNATITEPTPIAGTISEGAWTLEVRRGGRDDVTTEWSVLASGVGAASGVLATYGKLSQRIDFMAQTVKYAHDAAGRVLSRTYPDASIVSFTYFADGRRKTVTDESGTTTYAYDLRGRPSSIMSPDGRKVEVGYDAAGRRASLTAIAGGQSHTTSYVYDAGRLAEVHDPLGRVTSLDHDPAGMRTALSYPNGVATTYAHDTRGRLTSIEAKHLMTDAVVQSLVYTLDAAGRRTQIAEPAGLMRAYGYDNVDRLTTESVSGGAEPAYSKTFAYDDVGNRMTQATTGAGAGTVAYSYDVRDRLLTEAGQTYGWDANGNLTSKQGGATYTWGFQNRLIEVTQPDGTVVKHVYDADGNRVETSVTPPGGPAVVTKYLVDTAEPLSHVVAETTGSGTLTALYVRAGDELLAVMRPAGGGTWTTRWVHHDAIGSVRVMTDEAGLVTDARSYEAFGKKAVDTGSDPLAYGFAGEPFDGATELAYHRARWMDPGVGRFLSTDPLLFCTPNLLIPGVDHFPTGSLAAGRFRNGYSYTNANPVGSIDPSGLDDFSLSGISIGISVQGLLGTLATVRPIIPVVVVVVVSLSSPYRDPADKPWKDDIDVCKGETGADRILCCGGVCSGTKGWSPKESGECFMECIWQ